MDNMVFFSETESVMLAFVRLAVLNKDSNILDNGNIDWDELFVLSAEQGVLAWVWDGINKHPRRQELSRQQVIEWGLSAQKIWDQYARFKHVLGKMIKICEENNIRLLLFKGIAQSELYPKPESRPSGDIDIFLFDDYERGNILFAHKNVSRTNKRTGFDYEGVPIENHRIFLNTYTKLQKKVIHYLETTLSNVSYSKDGYYVMEPTASVVYQVMHFMTHVEDYTSLASIRFIIDFGITLDHYKQDIDPEYLKSVLLELKIMDLFCLLTEMAEETLNVSFPLFHYKLVSIKDKKSVFKLILSREQNYVPLKERGYLEIIFFYLRRFNDYKYIIKYLPRSQFKFYIRNIRLMSAVLIRKVLNLDDKYPILKGLSIKLK